MTKKERKRYTEDGLPINALDWRREDWEILFYHVQQAKREIADHHKEEREGGKKP